MMLQVRLIDNKIVSNDLMNSILWPNCPKLQTSNKTVTLGSKFLSQIWMPLRLCIINKTQNESNFFQEERELRGD